jgi:hypothetical protein
MNNATLVRKRLSNQGIANKKFASPEEVVKWLGAVQAQDYAGGKWTIGLRSGFMEAEIEAAINEGRIVRTWPMRGTLHFVASEDLRWMLSLGRKHMYISPRQYKQYEVDEKLLSRCYKILLQELTVNRSLTREEIADYFRRKKIETDTIRLSMILYRASLEELICFGAKRGKQFTFVLLDQWIADTRPVGVDDALKILTTRYFLSHGPAQIKDFMWWSGMNKTEAVHAMEMVKDELESDTCHGETFWLAKELTEHAKSTSVYLLPQFDEYLIGYSNRSAILTDEQREKISTGNGLFSNTIIHNGIVIGTWKKEIKKNLLTMEVQAFTNFNNSAMKKIETAKKAYASYLQLPLETKRRSQKLPMEK